MLKNILVAVTGASPQVLSETLYALHTQGKSFPDEICVITVQDAKAMLVQGLIIDGHWLETGKHMRLARKCWPFLWRMNVNKCRKNAGRNEGKNTGIILF